MLTVSEAEFTANFDSYLEKAGHAPVKIECADGRGVVLMAAAEYERLLARMPSSESSK